MARFFDPGAAQFRWIPVRHDGGGTAFPETMKSFLLALMLVQEPTAVAHKHIPGPADIIMPHLTDSKHVELPCVKGWEEWACEVTLPTWNVRIGSKTIDFGPTKHVVFL